MGSKPEEPRAAVEDERTESLRLLMQLRRHVQMYLGVERSTLELIERFEQLCDETGRSRADSHPLREAHYRILRLASAYDRLLARHVREALGVSAEEARAELQWLVDLEYLERHGKGRGTYYVLAETLQTQVTTPSAAASGEAPSVDLGGLRIDQLISILEGRASQARVEAAACETEASEVLEELTPEHEDLPTQILRLAGEDPPLTTRKVIDTLGLSRSWAQKEVTRLVRRGQLTRHGVRRGTYYVLVRR